MPNASPARRTQLRSPLPPGAPGGARGRVLEAALAQFAERGFHATSVRDLAGELGLQPGALYAHFDSKDALLAELVRIGHEAHHKALRSAILEAGKDPADQLAALVRAHATMHAEYPQLSLLVNEELHSLPPQLAAPSLAIREQSTALLTDVVQRGIQAGRFHPPDAEVTLAAIGGMGMRIPHWYRPERKERLTPRQLGELHAQLALRMLGAKR